MNVSMRTLWRRVAGVSCAVVLLGSSLAGCAGLPGGKRNLAAQMEKHYATILAGTHAVAVSSVAVTSRFEPGMEGAMLWVTYRTDRDGEQGSVRAMHDDQPELSAYAAGEHASKSAALSATIDPASVDVADLVARMQAREAECKAAGTSGVEARVRAYPNHHRILSVGCTVSGKERTGRNAEFDVDGVPMPRTDDVAAQAQSWVSAMSTVFSTSAVGAMTFGGVSDGSPDDPAMVMAHVRHREPTVQGRECTQWMFGGALDIRVGTGTVEALCVESFALDNPELDATAINTAQVPPMLAALGPGKVGRASAVVTADSSVPGGIVWEVRVPLDRSVKPVRFDNAGRKLAEPQR